MASSVKTPGIKFRLDDSEKIRLEKLRNRLKLHHWEKIQRTYHLVPDNDVASKIEALKTTDPIKYEEKHSFWEDRYSDFGLHWKKIRNNDTNVIEGHLMACGNLRIPNLGEMSEGCRVSLMSGIIKDEPLPLTKVGDLRINHIYLDIIFDSAIQIENPDHAVNNSKTFKVGLSNQLYGHQAVLKNLNAFKKKQDEKKGRVTREFLQSFMDSVRLSKNDEERSKESHSGDDEWAEVHSEEEEDTRSQPTQYRGIFTYGSSSLQNHHNDIEEQFTSYSKSKEQLEALDVTAKMTIGSSPSTSTPKQRLANATLVEKQQERDITESDNTDLDDLTVVPKGDDATNVQVR